MNWYFYFPIIEKPNLNIIFPLLKYTSWYHRYFKPRLASSIFRCLFHCRFNLTYSWVRFNSKRWNEKVIFALKAVHICWDRAFTCSLQLWYLVSRSHAVSSSLRLNRMLRNRSLKIICFVCDWYWKDWGGPENIISGKENDVGWIPLGLENTMTNLMRLIMRPFMRFPRLDSTCFHMTISQF